ncbi:MAG: hypothetical protein UHZ06_01710 [Paludibacteraceae bacterium]|nr:hypothetical protein [Paludibacteraceae bacterium]
MKPYNDYKHILKLNLNGYTTIIAKSNDINELKKIADDTKAWLEKLNEKRDGSVEIKTAQDDSLYRFYND